MTLGALTLMMMATPPISATAQPLTVLAPPPAGAAESVYATSTKIKPQKWSFVVVHAAADMSNPVAQGCHFIISRDSNGKWRALATDAWRSQRSGSHIDGYYGPKSIGVCLIGNFSRNAPANGQFACLIDLVNVLQEICGIPAEKIYLMSDLDARSTSPGRFFPAGKFAARLLHQGR